MALEYDLFLALRYKNERLLEPLLELPGFRGSGGQGQGPGLFFGVYNVSPDRRELLLDDYGIDSRIDVGFRVDLSAYDDERGYLGNRTVITAALAVLKAVPCNAILLYNGESPLMLRREGKLWLNRASGWWTSKERLDLVDLPYAMKDLPSL